jgi:hypothetical protein
VHPKPVILILTAVHPDGLADLLGVLALGGELRNVLNDQEGPVVAAIRRRIESKVPARMSSSLPRSLAKNR